MPPIRRAIPFASLWLYDPATGEPEYGTLTSANGYYEFDAIATNRTYRLEISGRASSLQTRQIEMNTLPGIEGRRYFHSLSSAARRISLPYSPWKRTFPNRLPPMPGRSRIFTAIFGHNLRNGYLIDENGGTVCLMFSGIIPTNPMEYETLMNASTALNVTRIEYYRFDYAETPYYDSALNFVLNLTINVPDISDPDWGL